MANSGILWYVIQNSGKSLFYLINCQSCEFNEFLYSILSAYPHARKRDPFRWPNNAAGVGGSFLFLGMRRAKRESGNNGFSRRDRRRKGLYNPCKIVIVVRLRCDNYYNITKITVLQKLHIY